MSAQQVGSWPCACGETRTRFVVAGRYARAGASNLPFSIVECAACRLMRTVPRPDQDQYAGGFGLSSDDGAFTGRLSNEWSPRIAQRIRAETSGRLLDVGCAEGALVEAASELGFEAEGIDLDSVAVAAGQAAGRRIAVGSVDDVEGPFDVIVMNHVLEHILDLPGVLLRAAELLASRGRLYVFVPNHRGWPARIMGTRWLGWAPHYHAWHFDPATLRASAESLAPLRVVSLTTRGGTESPSAGVKGIVKQVVLSSSRLARRGDQIEAVMERR